MFCEIVHGCTPAYNVRYVNCLLHLTMRRVNCHCIPMPVYFLSRFCIVIMHLSTSTYPPALIPLFLLDVNSCMKMKLMSAFLIAIPSVTGECLSGSPPPFHIAHAFQIHIICKWQTLCMDF